MKPDREKQTPPRMPQTLDSASRLFHIVGSDSSRKLGASKMAAHALARPPCPGSTPASGRRPIGGPGRHWAAPSVLRLPSLTPFDALQGRFLLRDASLTLVLERGHTVGFGRRGDGAGVVGAGESAVGASTIASGVGLGVGGAAGAGFEAGVGAGRGAGEYFGAGLGAHRDARRALWSSYPHRLPVSELPV
ncbi:MAG: hypothetical protein PVI78_04260 [Anaerolineales bacterium]